MSNKTAHRLLQRLVEDEIGEKPALQYCHNLIQQHPRKEGEGKEEYISRIYLDNKESLALSARHRTANR